MLHIMNLQGFNSPDRHHAFYWLANADRTVAVRQSADKWEINIIFHADKNKQYNGKVMLNETEAVEFLKRIY